MKPEQWDWIEFPLGELGGYKTFKDITKRYRNSRPVGLITRLEGLNDFVVLNLLAPRHAAFWSAARLSVFFGAHEHLLKSGCSRDRKKLFIQDLRKAGIKLADPAIRMFDLYTEFFPSRTNSVPGFSRGGVVTSESCRMVSTGCHVKLLPQLMTHFELEVDQFDEYAFFKIDDRLTLGSPLHYDKLDIAAYIFRLWQPPGHWSIEYMAIWRENILMQLEQAIDRIGAGEHLDMPIEPFIVLRPCPSFVLREYESPPHYLEINDPIARKILSLRARLIRILAWPVFYDDVVNALAKIEYEPRRLDGYGKFEPYDVIPELEAYRTEMESIYPCLVESPFRRQGVSE